MPVTTEPLEHVADDGLAGVQRDQGHLDLDPRDPLQAAPRAPQHFVFEALDVELQEYTRTGRTILIEQVVETIDLDLLTRLWRKVRRDLHMDRQHLAERARAGVA